MDCLSIDKKQNPLTEQEIKQIIDGAPDDFSLIDFAREIERAHGIGVNND